jgi:prolyl 4-hydroxylase
MVDVPMRFEDERLLWVVDDVYSADECAEIVQRIERSAPTIATNNPIYRDQDRVMVDDAETTAELFRRLRPHLPERMGSLVLVGLNDRLRFYRYREGQRFAPHMDHWYRPDERRITLHTVLVYFNDDFEGGETRFMEQLDEVVRPKRGSVAVFQHKLRHEGCPVLRGTKYALRSDVIYEASSPIGRVGDAR